MRSCIFRYLLGISSIFLVQPICSAQTNPNTLNYSEKLGSLPLRNAILEELHGATLIQPKIIRGLYAKPGDDPWQVALVLAGGSRVFCGASLISDSWVVTAAHCVDNSTSITQFEILAATTNIATGGVRSTVAEIILHPGYLPSNKPRSDIALLRLKTPLKADGAQPIEPLGKIEEVVALAGQANARVTGWGAVAEGGGPVKDLRFVAVKVFSNNDCNDPVAYNGDIFDEMVCAGFTQGGKDSCQGDSGGPLTVTVGIKSKLAGIVSWGEGCARVNRYGVYTRIASFAVWINNCIGGSALCHNIQSEASNVGNLSTRQTQLAKYY